MNPAIYTSPITIKYVIQIGQLAIVRIVLGHINVSLTTLLEWGATTPLYNFTKLNLL